MEKNQKQKGKEETMKGVAKETKKRKSCMSN